MGENNVHSGWQVLMSTAFTGTLLALLKPWIGWKVKIWTQSYQGIEFPPGYADQIGQTLVTFFTLGVGVAHMIAIKVYRGDWRVPFTTPNPPTRLSFHYVPPPRNDDDPTP